MSAVDDKPTYLFVLSWSLAHLGGVNQVVINLARQLEQAGDMRALVLIGDWDAPVPVWEQSHGLTTVRWRIRGLQDGMGPRQRLAYRWWERSFRREFARFCAEQRVVAINCHYPDLPAFTLQRVAAQPGRAIPVILSFHGAELANIATLAPAAIAAWQQLVARATASVVCSSDLGRAFTAVLGDATRPVVIHNGLDADRFVALAGAIAPQAGPRRCILSVGKFEHKKGQDVLIAAFAAIAAARPDVDLVLLGASAVGGNLPALQAQSQRLGVAARVLFHSDTPHDEVARFYRDATLFALPSRQEPFGIVILEAGAFALPVVASRVGGVPEIIDDAKHGLLVAADDAEALAQALGRLLDAPAEAEAMGARLHQRVKTQFTWRAACEKYLALI